MSDNSFYTKQDAIDNINTFLYILSSDLLSFENFNLPDYLDRLFDHLTKTFQIPLILVRKKDELEKRYKVIVAHGYHNPKNIIDQATDVTDKSPLVKKLKEKCKKVKRRQKRFIHIDNISSPDVQYDQADFFSNEEKMTSLLLCPILLKNDLVGFVTYHKKDNFQKELLSFLTGSFNKIIERGFLFGMKYLEYCQEYLSEQKDNAYMLSNFALLLHDVKGHITDPPQIIKEVKEIVVNSSIKSDKIDLIIEGLDVAIEDLEQGAISISEALQVQTRFSSINNLSHYINRAIKSLVDYYQHIAFKGPKSNGHRVSIEGDVTKLKYLFFNIVDNSCKAIVKAIDEGIIYANEGCIEIYLRESSDNKWVNIDITDNGIGMQKDKLNHIFQKGFSSWNTKNSTGVGLSLCNDLIEQHYGRLEVDSNYKEGTTVRISLRKKISKAGGKE